MRVDPLARRRAGGDLDGAGERRPQQGLLAPAPQAVELRPSLALGTAQRAPPRHPEPAPPSGSPLLEHHQAPAVPPSAHAAAAPTAVSIRNAVIEALA
mgnify:CR=1 FL=1